MTIDPAEQDAVIEFLSRPESYGSGVSGVDRLETHGAFVFLAGDRAYKLKRAVRFPYMDYSSLEKRRLACEAELIVNRTAAPKLYLDVMPIVRQANGTLGFGQKGGAEVLDWVVLMRRFSQQAVLENMRKSGKLTAALMTRLAEVIWLYHSRANPVQEFGGASGLSMVIEENVEVLSSLQGTPFSEQDITSYAEGSRHMLAQQKDRLQLRMRSGLVRHCHGDLHLNNICLMDGEPVLFDAVEFSKQFSCIDVFYDIAYLIMDLDHNGERAFANLVLNRYLEKSADYDGLAVLPLFLSARAAIRAHVRAMQGRPNDLPRRESVSYLSSAIGYLKPEPAQLILLGGLSGTGKSTLARSLAPTMGSRPGAITLRSDVLRKRLWRVEENERLPQAAYDVSVSKQVYELIEKYCREILEAGFSAIVDAVFGSPEERDSFARLAASMKVSFKPIWLEAPLPTLEARVGARTGDVSDANVEVLRRQAAAIVAPSDWLRINAGGTPAATLSNVETILRQGTQFQ